jgi:hypothetical protein
MKMCLNADMRLLKLVYAQHQPDLLEEVITGMAVTMSGK